jgi:hypothetical protein
MGSAKKFPSFRAEPPLYHNPEALGLSAKPRLLLVLQQEKVQLPGLRVEFLYLRGPQNFSL